MLKWSNQHRIVTDTSMSFQKLQKTYLKTSSSLVRDQVFLKESKYLTKTENDFRFIVLWTILKYSTNAIDTFKMLQSYSLEDLKLIEKDKMKIVLFRDTINKDFQITRPKVLAMPSVNTMYQKGEVSILYFYWFISRLGDDSMHGRVQAKTIERIRFFMEYFPFIRDYLDGLDGLKGGTKDLRLF